MKKLFTLFICVLAILLFGSVASFAGVTKEIPYASSSTVTPNVLIILDNSGSMATMPTPALMSTIPPITPITAILIP